MKSLKQRIQSGETVHGCWISLGSLISAEIVGRAGFDWVLIDLEHGAGNTGTMLHQLQVLAGTGATAIVRTDERSRSKVQRILDGGAEGIMFPQMQTSAEALQAVQFMYYPPRGIRGMAKVIRANGFGTNVQGYVAGIENTVLGIIQIETREALEDIDAIAATQGVDVLFVGPNDLSLALGVYAQYEHPDYINAMKTVATAAKNNNKVAGVLLQDLREYEMYSDLGFRFLASGADASFVAKGAGETIKHMNDKRGHSL
jgi:2-keto-3-deoxy-L-rhamnonate aldolase RhmA